MLTGAGGCHTRRQTGHSAGGGPGSRQALLSARAAFFYPELAASAGAGDDDDLGPTPYYGAQVDTLITDSNGNTSRYDESGQHVLTLAPSLSPGGGGLAARASGPRGGGERDSCGSSSPIPVQHLDPFADGSGRSSGRYTFPTSYLTHNDNNNHNVNDVGMTNADGPQRRPSPGTPAHRSSQGASPRASNGHHHQPHARPSQPSKPIRPVIRRRSSTSSSDEMSQESPLLTPSPSTPTPTSASQAHHPIRAASFREPKTAAEARDEEEEEEGDRERRGVMNQARRNSMPNVNNFLNVPGASSASRGSGESPKDATRIRRVRSFKTTSKGVIVNRGDSFKKKSTHSLMSTGSTVTDSDHRTRGNNNNTLAGAPAGMGVPGVDAPAYFRVKVMGAAGVGKTSMAHQFLTSESVDHDDTDETHQMTVTVLLDGEESTIEFIDSPNRNGMEEDQEHPSDAYVVVFAINDHDSFCRAEQLVRFLRVDYGTDRAIVLVANKIDLVRKRKVTADEARLVATTFDCKYAETSAALNHHVDELLVGIITQIRLQLAIPFTTIFFPHKDAKRRKDRKTLCKGPKGFFSRLFRRSSSQGSKRDRGVDNLLY